MRFTTLILTLPQNTFLQSNAHTSTTKVPMTTSSNSGGRADVLFPSCRCMEAEIICGWLSSCRTFGDVAPVAVICKSVELLISTRPIPIGITVEIVFIPEGVSILKTESPVDSFDVGVAALCSKADPL